MVSIAFCVTGKVERSVDYISLLRQIKWKLPFDVDLYFTTWNDDYITPKEYENINIRFVPEEQCGQTPVDGRKSIWSMVKGMMAGYESVVLSGKCYDVYIRTRLDLLIDFDDWSFVHRVAEDIVFVPPIYWSSILNDHFFCTTMATAKKVLTISNQELVTLIQKSRDGEFVMKNLFQRNPEIRLCQVTPKFYSLRSNVYMDVDNKVMFNDIPQDYTYAYYKKMIPLFYGEKNIHQRKNLLEYLHLNTRDPVFQKDYELTMFEYIASLDCTFVVEFAKNMQFLPYVSNLTKLRVVKTLYDKEEYDRCLKFIQQIQQSPLREEAWRYLGPDYNVYLQDCKKALGLCVE